MPRKIPKILRNRYAVVLIGFFLYLLFFDPNDLISQIKIRLEIKEINKQADHLQADSQNVQEQIRELTTNTASQEKFAREQYRMKRENEDIFVIVDEGN